jgi:hypothetical protein
MAPASIYSENTFVFVFVFAFVFAFVFIFEKIIA